MQGELAQVQWVSLHMQGASFPLHPLPPCPNPTPKSYGIIYFHPTKSQYFYQRKGIFLDEIQQISTYYQSKLY